ncbi:MAG: LysM peptidoglycan-binding domain-containing protein [Gammaproteobacteria bacterium]|nr:LysM peptidoglycan-binding domain-containing protein [Gammaproteobacteria bacterium]
MTNTHLDSDTLAKFENWYGKRPEYFDRLAERAYWFLPYILSEVEKRGMPTEVALLPAIESTFRPDATSRAKAAGIWQFMSSTGRRFGLEQNWWIDNRRDLVSSTTAALDYLDYLSSKFNGDWELAFAAYNAGEGRVGRAIKKNIQQNLPSYYSFLDLSKETKQYIPKLIAVRNIVSNPEKYGITLKDIPVKQVLDTIDAESQTDLAVVASLIDIPMERLAFFNRNYKRGVTHPKGPHMITIPTELSEILTSKLANLTARERLRWARHRVKKGEYLGKIARKHSVTVDSIMDTNNLSSNLIKPGQELRIPISTGRHNYNTSSRYKPIKIKEGDTLYVVQSGDSLWAIANRANIRLSNLLSWNNMTKRTRLYPGQKLIVGR